MYRESRYKLICREPGRGELLWLPFMPSWSPEKGHPREQPETCLAGSSFTLALLAPRRVTGRWFINSSFLSVAALHVFKDGYAC